MSHFYGELRTNNDVITKVGYKSLGIRVLAASSMGSVIVSVKHDKKSGLDIAKVRLSPWEGQGNRKLLFHGAINGQPINSIREVEWKADEKAIRSAFRGRRMAKSADARTLRGNQRWLKKARTRKAAK